MTRAVPAPPRRGPLALGIASAILGVLTLSGCPGEIDPSLINPNPNCDPTPIFMAKTCAGAGVCHDANGAGGGFNMATPGWETHLVGVNPMGGGSVPSACGTTMPYLVPNVLPATGLFLDKLKPTFGCGERMPKLQTVLTAAEMTCVQKWANQLVMAGMTGGGTDGGTDTGSAGQ